jgi:hypothetical protein
MGPDAPGPQFRTAQREEGNSGNAVILRFLNFYEIKLISSPEITASTQIFMHP